MATSSTEPHKHEAPNTKQEEKQEARNGCCGGPAPSGSDACCAVDAEVKSTGGPGCGCGPKAPAKKGCC